MTAEVNHHIGLEGIFNFKLTNTKTGETRQFEFKNLILNSGLDRMAAGPFIAGCVLGSASSTPTVTDTSITSILGSSTTLQANGIGTTNTTTPPYWRSSYWTYRFIEGKATGNISQVAMAFGTVNTTTNSYTGLFSLALVKDSNGTPITITKLADEVLDVTYTLQLYCPASDVTGTVSISGVSYNYIVRPALAAVWWPASATFENLNPAYASQETIGTQLTAPSNMAYNMTSSTVSSYTAGSFTRDYDVLWDLNQGNVAGGIRSVRLASTNAGTHWQIEYSNATDGTAIPKDATKRLTLKYRFTWGRV